MKRALTQASMIMLALALSYLTWELARTGAAMLRLQWQYLDVTPLMVGAAAWPACWSATAASVAWVTAVRTCR